ncbi:MAG: hypothetical protein L6Q38_12695, partial [Nitrospira sp.]|nr:hypothetical protein [Nitrospira sp.]
VSRGVGVETVDVSDPAHPAAVGLMPVTFATGVHVEGTKAYVVDAQQGLYIFDCSSPGLPRELGRMQLPANQSPNAVAVTVAGRYAYLASRGGSVPGLVVVDVVDPARPTIVARHPTVNGVTDVVVRNNLAYLAVVGGTFQIVDVTQPTAPRLVSEWVHGGSDAILDVVDSTAFIFALPLGICALDVSEPSLPRLVGAHALPAFPADAVVANSHAFIVDNTSLEVVDVRDPLRMESAGDWLAGIDVQDVAPVGTNLMVAGAQGGLIVLEPRASGGFEQAGRLPLAYARWIDIEDDRAYVWGSLSPTASSPTHELVVLDITRPVTPVLLGRCSMLTKPSAAQVYDGFAYSAEANELIIRDVRDPSAIAEVGRLKVPADNAAFVLRVTEGLVFLTLADGNAFLADVRHPARPVNLGVLPNSPGITDGAFIGGRLVTTSTKGGVQVWDLADPSRPKAIGNVPAAAFAAAVPMNPVPVGEVLLVRLSTGMVVPIDLWDPTQPLLRPSLSIFSGSLFQTPMPDGRSLVVAGLQGLRLVTLRAGLAQTLEFSLPTERVATEPLLLTATATSGLPVKFEVLSGLATIVDDRLIPTGAGEVVVRAVQLGDELWLGASAERRLQILPARQWITWREPEGVGVKRGDTHPLLAEASSGLPVTFRVESGLGAIADQTLTATGKGPIRVVAEQAGDALYAPTSRAQTYNPESGDLSWIGGW